MANGKTEKPLEVMSRDQLEEHIVEFVKSHNVCVLATCKDNIPRATPLEYVAEGTTLYIHIGPGRKLENISANPIVSAGINDPLHGWLSVKGVQITGKPRLITDGHAEYPDAWKVFNRANMGKVGWDTPPKGYTLLVIEADKIELFETALKQKGYKIRQFWEA